MKITRKEIRRLIAESYRKGGYIHPNDPKHQRNREAYDGDGPGDPSMSGVYGDPNEKLRGSTIEYPGGKKAFLQSMIDTYRRVGMHDEADRSQAELDAMTDDIFKATLEESLDEGFFDKIKGAFSNAKDSYMDALSTTRKDADAWNRLADEVLVPLKSNNFYKDDPNIDPEQGINIRLDEAIDDSITNVVARNKELIQGLQGYSKQMGMVKSLGIDSVSDLADRQSNPEIILLGILASGMRSRDPYFIKYMALNYQRLTLRLGDSLGNEYYSMGVKSGGSGFSPLSAESDVRKMIRETIIDLINK